MSALNGVTSAIVGAANVASGGSSYQVDRSLRFNSPDEAYLNRTPSSGGNRRTWTWSSWVKRGSATANNPVVFSADTNNNPWTAWQFTQSDGTIQITTSAGVSPGLITNAQFRDFSAWYHIVIAMDTTQATQADRVKLYVNGVEQTFSNTNYPSQNFDTKVNGTFAHYIGYTNNQYFDGYLGEIHFIDGQALAPTAFAEYDDNNNWNPKDCKDDLTYGTNGFYLNFSDNSSSSALGTDSSGNGNNWTVNNITHGPTTKTFTAEKPDGSAWGNIANAFDGNTGTYADGTAGNGTTSKIFFNPPITGVTSLRVYWYGTSNYGYNSTSVGTGSTTAEWKSVYSGSAIDVYNIIGISQPGNGVVRLYAIEICRLASEYVVILKRIIIKGRRLLRETGWILR